MYTTNLANSLSKLLSEESLDSFFSTLRTEADKGDFSTFADAIDEEWRKLQIAKKNGLMDDEQVRFALTAYFKRESNALLDVQASNS